VPIPAPYQVPIGTSVQDTAAIIGEVPGLPATGTVTYEFFTTIDGTGPHTDEMVTLNPDGTVPASALHGPLAAGAYSFVAVYSGDPNYQGSTSDAEPLTVGSGTPAVGTAITDANGVPIPFPYQVALGTSVHDTATIIGQASGVPATGTVTYEFFTTIDGTGAHTDEVVTLNSDGTVPDSALHGPLAAGAYSFVAVYSGDSNYLNSISSPEPLIVEQGTSSAATAIVDANHVPIPAPHQVALGTTVADTAAVAGSAVAITPTGTVTYQFYKTIDGTGAHSDDVVTLNPDGTVPDSPLRGPLAAGAYSFVAVYSGDANYKDSASAVEPLTVEQGASTSVTVIVDANGAPITSPAALGTSVGDTVTISGQVPGLPATGTLTYKFFTTNDGTGPSSDEIVKLNPDGSVPDSSLHGPLTFGAYSFVAIYSGDVNYQGSTSAVEPLTVQKGKSGSSTAIVDVNHVPIPAPYQVPLGTSVHDTATVTGQGPSVPATGTVTYEFFTTIDGTGAHTDQVVTLNPDGTVPDSALQGPLAAGAYSFVAVYSGDSNYLGSTSAVEPLTVQQATSSTVTAITDVNHVPIPAPYQVPIGTSVQDTAAIIGEVPGLPATGTMTYEFFTTIDGTGPHTDEMVTLNPDGTVPASALHGPLAAGAYSFVAVYSGDANYQGSTSPVEALTVAPPVAPPSVSSLQRFGFHAQPTRLVPTFSSVLDAARAQDRHNYTLKPIGPKGHLGSRIPVASAVYDPVANTVTLHFTTRLYLFHRYKLVINGTAPSGLASPSGVLLDGEGTGVPGTNYVAIFGPSILAQPHPPIPGATRSKAAHSKITRNHATIGAHDSHRSESASITERHHAHPGPGTAAVAGLSPNVVDAALGTVDGKDIGRAHNVRRHRPMSWLR
jgi:type IV secretory pathway TrbF-like protein